MADNRFTAAEVINGGVFFGKLAYGNLGAAVGAAAALAYLDIIKGWGITYYGWAWNAGNLLAPPRLQDAITAAFVAAPWVAQYFNLWPITQYTLAGAVPLSYIFANNGGVVYDTLRNTGLLTGE